MVIIRNGVCEGITRIRCNEVRATLDGKRVTAGYAIEGVCVARDKIQWLGDGSIELVVMSIFQRVEVPSTNVNGPIDRYSCRFTVRTETLARDTLVIHVIHVTHVTVHIIRAT